MNPRTPTGQGPEPCAFDLAWQPPLRAELGTSLIKPSKSCALSPKIRSRSLVSNVPRSFDSVGPSKPPSPVGSIAFRRHVETEGTPAEQSRAPFRRDRTTKTTWNPADKPSSWKVRKTGNGEEKSQKPHGYIERTQMSQEDVEVRFPLWKKHS